MRSRRHISSASTRSVAIASLVFVFICFFPADSQAIHPEPFIVLGKRFFKWLEPYLDDLYALAPVVVMLFAKAGGVATTLVTAVHARAKRSVRPTFLFCMILGMVGGVWSSQAWFGSPFSGPMNAKNLVICAICVVGAVILWAFIALVPSKNDDKNPEPSDSDGSQP
jgi:hypothetical protein